MILQHQILKRLSKIVSFFLIVEILLCHKLWFPMTREFPMMSAFNWLDFSIGRIADSLLSAFILITLISIFFNRFKKLALAVLLCCLFILILEDITRLQPWVYTQVALLVLLNLNKPGQENAILSGVLWLVALVYIWSGIQKLNLGFLQETFPWMLSAFGFDSQITADEPISLLTYLFAIVPLLELLIGVFLIISKTRRIGVILGLLMHTFIILSIGPTGHNWNMIVLPWNLCLVLLLFQFYAQKKPLLITNGIKSFKFNYIILILFGVMPALNFIGYWDNGLSSTMYSGTHSNVIFYSETNSDQELPPFRNAATLSTVGSNSANSISKTWLTSWSVYDIKVPFYAADRYYKRFGKKLCESSKNTSKAGIEIIIRSKFTAEQSIIKCSCLMLLKSNN